MKQNLILFSAPALMLATVTFAQAPAFNITLPDELESAISEEMSAVWMGYLIARCKWIEEHPEVLDSKDFEVYIPKFKEEVSGRTAMVGLWEASEKPSDPGHAQYLNQLANVEREGWMKEYVWHFLRRDGWTEGPHPDRLDAFRAWAKEHLQNHRVITIGKIAISRKESANQPSQAAPSRAAP